MGFNVRSALGALRSAGLPVSSMRLSGAQARNSLWIQLKADITGAELMVQEIPDGELAGNAALAAAALEGLGVDEVTDRMIRIKEIFGPRNRDFWEQEYLNHVKVMDKQGQ